jgi:hypothetical protein
LRLLPLALLLGSPGLSGNEHELTRAVEVLIALNHSKSGRGGAAPKTSMRLAQMAVGTDDNEGMRVGTAVGK